MPCHAECWSLTEKCVCVRVCVFQSIHLFISFFLNHSFQWSVGAEFSSSLLTVDCKCLNLGRQPFLITRITLLSNRKIKLNNAVAYSWSQTAALRTHQSPLKLFHAPPSARAHTHSHTQAAIHRHYTNGISSTFSLITVYNLEKASPPFFFF